MRSSPSTVQVSTVIPAGLGEEVPKAGREYDSISRMPIGRIRFISDGFRSCKYRDSFPKSECGSLALSPVPCRKKAPKVSAEGLSGPVAYRIFGEVTR